MKKLSIVFAFLAFIFSSVHASFPVLPKDVNASIKDGKEAVNIFVHITALKAGKNGIKSAEVSKITLAQGQKPGKGVIRAKLKREGNRLQFEIQMAKAKFDRLVMPQGFVINDRISKLLGSSQKIVMKGGAVPMLKKTETRMLWFEIQ